MAWWDSIFKPSKPSSSKPSSSKPSSSKPGHYNPSYVRPSKPNDTKPGAILPNKHDQIPGGHNHSYPGGGTPANPNWKPKPIGGKPNVDPDAWNTAKDWGNGGLPHNLDNAIQDIVDKVKPQKPYYPPHGGDGGGGNGGGGGYDSGYTPPTPGLDIQELYAGLLKPGEVTRPGLIKLPYGDMYDLTYDSDKILGIFNDATDAKYKALEEDYAATENQYLKNILANQELAQKTINDAESQAVATGASKGMQAANQLSAILGMQQQGAEGALELSNEGNKLKNKKASETAENASKALETSNAVKNAIAQLDLQKYGYDTQWGVGQMDYNAAINDALAAIISAQINANR